MTTTNITNFRKNAFQYVEQTVKYNEPLNICTKDGNAVLLSEEDYSGIMETLYLVSVPECGKSSWRPRPNRWKIVLTNRLWSGKCTKLFIRKPRSRTFQS